VTSSPRAAVTSLIARLDKDLNLEEIIGTDVSSSGKRVIHKELGWTEYRSPTIASGLLHLYSKVETIIRIERQSIGVIEMQDGLRKR